ncbi:hypothetical protein H9655_02705 [Cytobacillus sp. Sa5YUA1]|uniref:Homeodomain phBC6A51-type domain-containing protein n=1 Tax=Cytobacillus stercorigallinarum TaxID=2762240 RepID=A0ABR8QK80_9BACI|nr:phBC6A51 family helix-turn-helix protein [Cytobacillus stercorigallinarum]MBD7935927.1 hypothetical protein [Cytobacillus stercorigallinarum]
MTNEELKQGMKNVPVPTGLTDEQVKLAQAFVTERYTTGIKIADFCRKHNKSTETWYDWKKRPVFESYLATLRRSLVTDSEWETHEKIKQKVKSMALSEKGGVREIELYTKLFEHVVEADRQRNMEELGIVSEHEKAQDKTVEDKRNALLQRLKG